MTKGKSGGHYRSTISGRYVTSKHGVNSPRTTVFEKEGPKDSTGGAFRSAVSGRFVTIKYGKGHPSTTERNR